MSDDNTAEETVTTETEGAPEAPDEAGKEELTPEQLRAALKAARADAAKWRTSYREAEPLVQKAKDLEEANKTEAQKLAEQLAEAQRNGETAASQLARVNAAIKARLFDENGDLDMDLVDRLRGKTPEELEEDAQKLAVRFARKPSDTPTPSPGTKPRPRLDSARPTPGEPDTQLDPKKLALDAIRRG